MYTHLWEERNLRIWACIFPEDKLHFAWNEREKYRCLLRENNGNEKETPSLAPEMCEFHQTYF